MQNYLVVNTFNQHGEYVLSSHKSLDAAEKAAKTQKRAGARVGIFLGDFKKGDWVDSYKLDKPEPTDTSIFY